ncbi:MAG: YkgJ family cysteine cluster protein [Syntrophaceae bacterium]|nr:YkgJ family cysteine cluster protein [Syntrophaceae bacterium]
MKESLLCLRCGKCCFVDMTAYAQKEDFDRWRSEGRKDILNIIMHHHLVWAGDRIVSSETGDHSRECPFLYSSGRSFLCSIYETRPAVCRNYIPGSSELCPQWRGKEKGKKGG